MKLFLIIVVFLVGQVVIAQSPIYKQFSNNGYDFGQGVVELPDSSYVITGASSSFMDGPSQMFLLKVDSLGEYLWSHHYGGNETDWGRRVKYINNIGFYVGGYTNSTGSGAYDYALWKIDENGGEEWLKTYGTTGWERVHDMAITSDNGVILVGETNLTDDGLTDIYIVRTDIDGNVLWEQQLENPGNDNAFAIQQFDDSTFIIGGYYFDSTTDLKQAWLTRIEDDGTVVWETKWGTTDHFEISDIEIHNNLVFGIGTKSTDNDENYLFFFKMDGNNGTILVSDFVNTNGIKGSGITTHYSPGFFDLCTSYFSPDLSYGYEDLLFFGYTSDPYYYGNLGSIKYQTSQALGEMITSYNYSTVAVGYNLNIGPGGSSIFLYRQSGLQDQNNVYDNFDTESLVSVYTIENDKKLSIYPNPANQYIYIQTEITGEDDYSLQLIDYTGRVVKSVQTNQLSEFSMDISDINPGLYTLIIDNSNKNRIVKKIQIN